MRHFFLPFHFLLSIFVSIDISPANFYHSLYVNVSDSNIRSKNSFLRDNLSAATYLVFDFLVHVILLEFECHWKCNVQSSPLYCSLAWNLCTLYTWSSQCTHSLILFYTEVVWQFSKTNLKIMIRAFINYFSHWKSVFCLYHWRDRISEMNLTTLAVDGTSFAQLSDASQLLKLKSNK